MALLIEHKLYRNQNRQMSLLINQKGSHAPIAQYYKLKANYNITSYFAHHAKNYFIEYESFDKRALFGFIRLRIVNKNNNMTIFPILKNRGLIRELHVYGDTTAVSTYTKHACQHTGIGSGLLRLAEIKTMEHGLYGIVVISGEGVKSYYEKKGYYEMDTFMIKDFKFWEVWYYYLKANYYWTILILIFILHISIYLN